MGKRKQFEGFDKWWVEIAEPRMNHFIDNYLKNNPEYTEEDTGDYTDSGCVHRLVHEGDAPDILWETCQEVYHMGYNDEPWQMDMSQSLFCELDNIIELAYEAGQRDSKQIGVNNG